MQTPPAHPSPDLAEDPRLVANCPRCTYSLRGLPIEHRCPECGLAIDRRWRIFGGRAVPRKSLQHIWPIRVLIMAAVLIGTVAPAVAVFEFARRGMTPWPALYFVFPIVLLVFLMRKTKKFFALAADGLYIYHGRDNIERIAWERIGKAIDEPGGKSLTLPIDGKNRRIYTHAFFGVDVFATNSVTRAINQHGRISTSAEPQNVKIEK